MFLFCTDHIHSLHTGSDRKYVFMRLVFICLVLCCCLVVLSLSQLGYPTTDSRHADSTSPSFFKKAGTQVKSWKLSLRSLYRRQLCEGVVCSLLQRHQTSDKTVRSRATDAQEYGTLLLHAIDVIGDEVVFQSLCVSCPLFCTVVKLSHHQSTTKITKQTVNNRTEIHTACNTLQQW